MPASAGIGRALQKQRRNQQSLNDTESIDVKQIESDEPLPSKEEGVCNVLNFLGGNVCKLTAQGEDII